MATPPADTPSSAAAGAGPDEPGREHAGIDGTGPAEARHDASEAGEAPYVLDDQVGFLMRVAGQRHAAIFQAHMPYDLTPTQFATLIRLGEVGKGSQNQLGRLTAMDVATTKGVVDRLRAKGLVTLAADAADARRRVIALSAEGRRILPELRRIGTRITSQTLDPLSPRERVTLLRLLRRLG